MDSLLETDPQHIGGAIGRIPSGCAILTTAHGNRSTGLLVSWVQQAGFAPPCITVAIKVGRPAASLIDASACFLLNVVGEDAAAMLQHFGQGFSLDDDAFEGLAVEATAFGPAVKACIAHLACRVRQKVRVGDHDLYVAEVVGGDTTAGAKPYVHIRKNGLTY